MRLGFEIGFATLLGILLSTAVAGEALADGGPHGDYTLATDACAGCHRTHTAVTPQLLANTNTGLCLTCHGTGATGAETNVVDGVYDATNQGLAGGGFSFATQDTALAGSPVRGTVTSLHNVEGMQGYTATATMWGAGSVGSGAGSAYDLYCTSCHDPHGGDSYRILRTTVNGVPVTVSKTDESTKSYTTATYFKPAGQWEISSFCAACHQRYMVSSGGSGQNSSGDAIFAYRHRIDAPSGAVVAGIAYTFPTTITLPVSSSGGTPTTSPDNRTMVCVTCHVSHGTSATMGSASALVPWPGGGTAADPNARSALLRLNNRGVCQNCHRK